jgi:hypothetical protein
MALGRVFAVVIPFVLVQLYSQAQTRPNLAGTWTPTDKPSGLAFCAGSLTLAQDESSLRVQSGDEAHATAYRFDGTETREVLAPARARPPDIPPTAYVANKTRSVARAAWNGDQFVVVTHITMTMTWPSQLPGEFDREVVTKETYSLDNAGQLIVKRQVIQDPLPGGSTESLNLPDSSICAYTRAGQSSR